MSKIDSQLLYDLAQELKKNYQINQNISSHLTDSQKADLLCILENNEAVLKLLKLLIAKNNSLGKSNQIIGKQRSYLEKALKKEKEKNEKLNLEVIQLRCELQEFQSQIGISLNSLQDMLLSDILKRSEIIKFLQELIKSLQESKLTE